MSSTAALSHYRRVITSKRDGTCHACGIATVAHRDYAAVDASSQWFAFCTVCAGSYAAQVAGLVKRAEAAATDAPADNVATVVLPDEANVLAVMAGEANDALSYDTILKLHQAITHLTYRKPAPIVADTRVEALRAIGLDATAAPRDRSFAQSLVEQYDRKGSLSDKQWACADRMISSANSGPVAPVEVGLYLTTEGVIYKGYMTQNDRLGVKRLVVITQPDGTATGSFDFVRGGTKVLGALVAAGKARILTQDEASAFGKQYSFCCACARDLNDDRSIAAGYGPVCADNNGWHYPTAEQAAAILNRPTEVEEG